MSERCTHVLCVDDNRWIGESIQRMLDRHPDLRWAGWLPGAGELPGAVAATPHPDVLLLDIDIPGEDSFQTLDAVSRQRPEVRVVMLSGHVRPEYIDRAMALGAWGYVSKNEDTKVIIDAIRQAAAGQVALSPAVAAALGRR